jgi:prepilin-type N-terminal cleavage/methylation domain-containing protein
MSARRGFTLAEIIMAALILSVIMAAVMNGFMSMRRSQAVSVSRNLLQSAAQKALRNIYTDLSQSRKLLASSELDPATQDMGRDYFTRFQGITAPPAVNFLNMDFPRLDPNGGFGMEGPNSGERNPVNFGNALVFIGAGEGLRINRGSGTAIVYGNSPVPKFLSATPYFISSMRFTGYYLSERTLPSEVARIKLTPTLNSNHMLELRRWESQPYLDKNEFKAFTDKLVGGAASTKLVWDWLQAHSNPNYRVAGLWDATAATSASAFYTVDTGGVIVPVTGPVIAKRRDSRAVTVSTDPYALGMVAFNTRSLYTFPGITVPAYAPTDSAHENFPYGFEVGLTGPTGARSVLIRLTLAARVNAGLHLHGVAQQQLVKVIDM